MKHVHFIGIGGVGMSGLAHALLSRGVRVSGSDPHENAATERLTAQGATIYRTQEAGNIQAERPDLVVATAAIPEDNSELAAARASGAEVVTRAEFLGRLMAEYPGPRIGIAGTHGKTTTTAMVAEILLAADLDPTVLVGGEYAPIGGTARVGKGDTFLTEACEAYDSFHSLRPDIAVITNVEADHLDHYGNEQGVFESFRKFVAEVSPDGALIAAAEPGALRLLELAGAARPKTTVLFGLKEEHPNAKITARSIRHAGRGMRFDLFMGEERLGEVSIRVPGRHNVMNALAAAAVGLQVGVSFDKISAGLERFEGTGRRFELLGERNGVTVIDDYAHHPTEIRATLAAARQAYPERRLVAVFQPHLYSRTRDFLPDFAEALSEADAILLTEIYAAREKPIPGVRVSDLTQRIAEIAPSRTVLLLPSKSDVVGGLEWVTRPGDVVLVMGAGDIREAGEQFVQLS